MSLVVSTLRESIRPLFIPATMPIGSVSDVITQWVRAYITYAQTALAGPAAPIGLVPGGATGRFSDALDAAFRNLWMGASWAGPGVTGATLFVPPLSPLLESVGQSLIASRDPEQAISLISSTLHTYTLGITVTLIPATGTPIVAPIT